MELKFKGSEKATIGVELEFQLIDSQSRDLSPRSQEVLDIARQKGYDHIKAEVHQSMIEVDTEISDNVQDCRASIKKRFYELGDVCSALNMKACLSGTHPFQMWTERQIYPNERYMYLKERFQWLTRRMNVYGLHVHVGVANGQQVIDIMNEIIPYLPCFLALSCSSPFWHSVDTGLHSCRVGIMESFPYAGLPPYFRTWEDLEKFYGLLYKGGAIASMKDLYWFIRPNLNYGTLEFRLCDVMPTLTETMAMVALTQCLVVHLKNEKAKNGKSEQSEERIQNKFWLATFNQWSAAKDGLDAKIAFEGTSKKITIKEEIQQLLKLLQPTAKELGCGHELNYVHEMLKHGPSAKRQRAFFNHHQSYQKVVDLLVQEFEEDKPILL